MFTVEIEREQMKFKMGKIVVTKGVNNKIAEDEAFSKFILNSLARHANCDWGELNKIDWQENELSLKEGFRVLSAYTYKKDKVWIVTEADRSVTTVLFPDEY